MEYVEIRYLCLIERGMLSPASGSVRWPLEQLPEWLAMNQGKMIVEIARLGVKR